MAALKGLFAINCNQPHRPRKMEKAAKDSGFSAGAFCVREEEMLLRSI